MNLYKRFLSCSHWRLAKTPLDGLRCKKPCFLVFLICKTRASLLSYIDQLEYWNFLYKVIVDIILFNKRIRCLYATKSGFLATRPRWTWACKQSCQSRFGGCACMLISLHTRKFLDVCFGSADFFKKLFHNYHLRVKQFESRCLAWSWSKLFANGISRRQLMDGFQHVHTISTKISWAGPYGSPRL